MTTMVDQSEIDSQAEHFVKHYPAIHERIYGAAPHFTARDRRAAIKMAKVFLRDAGGPNEALEAINWLFAREKRREAWRRGNGKSGKVLTWRDVFGSEWLTEWRVELSRNRRPWPKPLESEPTEAAQAEPGTFQLTDVGNGERFARDHGERFRYCFKWRKWLRWGGAFWIDDASGDAEAAAKDVTRGLFLEAADAGERGPAVAKHALKSQSAGAIAAMLAMARSQAGIRVEPREIDADPWLFNCASGTIDLRSGELREHDPRDLITKISPAAYDPKASCPQWESFVSWAMGGDAESVAYLRRLLGRCLTGDVSEQILPVFWGSGANGKSVLMRVLGHVLGDYAHTAAPQLLLAGANERHLTELASLHGRRFVVCSETTEGRFFDETRIKMLTGGDAITCRRMRENEWSYAPTAKLFLITNHRPRVHGTDYAIWRRLRLVPFEQTISEKERDPKLAEKLEAEASGVLNWLVAGCVAWQREGLAEPGVVTQATSDYQAEQNSVARFLDDSCEKGPGKHARASYLLEQYNAWAKSRGEVALTQPELAARLKQLGFASERKKDGVHWLGVEVVTDRPLNSFLSRGYQ